VRRNAASKSRRGGNLSWRALDLHLHTPASSDYQEPKVTYLDILRSAEARGLDIIAFTDHNTVAGIRRLRDEIAELELLERLHRLMPDESNRLSEYRRLLDRILLLPGFEFTATFGFHILGIFPPETPVRDLEHLLLSLNVPPDQLDRGAVAVGATTDVLTAYRTIAEAGGLAIAAHANSTNGVAMRGFGFGGQTKIAFTQDLNLCALEVTDLDQKGRRTTSAFFSGTKPEYPRRMHCITGSDAHRLTRDPHNPRNLGVGERATDVLIDEVSFEALKELFAGSDFARIRFHVPGGSTVQGEFDHVQEAREEGANILQAFHESAQQKGGRQYAVVADACAFANTNGGTIYVGVSADPKQPPAGVPDPEQAMRELRSALARMLTPQLAFTVDLQETRGKKIIRILVPRGDDPPYAIEDSKIYVREEAETSLAVRDEIVQLVLRGSAARAAAPAPMPAEAAAKPPAAVEAAPAGGARPAPEPAPAAAGPVSTPRTGVEIVASEERDGVTYHTMRDLRNGSVVKNVTRTSARKLWHYAIMAKETDAFDPGSVTWEGSIGLWRRAHRGGQTRYDLVQRLDGEVRVFYGVTEDGVSGPWKRLIEAEERRHGAAQPEGTPASEPPTPPGPEQPSAPVGLLAPPPEARPAEPGPAAAEPAQAPELLPSVEAEPELTAEIETGAQEPAAAEPGQNGAGVARKRRARSATKASKGTGRTAKKTRAAPAEAPAAKQPGARRPRGRRGGAKKTAE
jgi:hypothetical protein